MKNIKLYEKPVKLNPAISASLKGKKINNNEKSEKLKINSFDYDINIEKNNKKKKLYNKTPNKIIKKTDEPKVNNTKKEIKYNNKKFNKNLENNNLNLSGKIIDDVNTNLNINNIINSINNSDKTHNIKTSEITLLFLI